MNNLTEKLKFDGMLGNSSGTTTMQYGWPLLDMSGYDRADFIINAFRLSATATAAGQGLVQCALYSGTAATSTALTAISSATASFGSPSSIIRAFTKAAKIYIDFNASAATGLTFDINGRTFTLQDSDNATLFYVKVAGATASSSLAACINSSKNTFVAAGIRATTDIPVGATNISSNMCMIYSINDDTYFSATGVAGATANEGIGVLGDFVAHIGIPTEKVGARFITIGVVSSGAKVPVSVNAIRSAGRFAPVKQNCFAADVNLGSTTT